MVILLFVEEPHTPLVLRRSGTSDDQFADDHIPGSIRGHRVFEVRKPTLRLALRFCSLPLSAQQDDVEQLGHAARVLVAVQETVHQSGAFPLVGGFYERLGFGHGGNSSDQVQVDSPHESRVLAETAARDFLGPPLSFDQ